MARFAHRPRTYPKYSDRPHIPFWINGDEGTDGGTPSYDDQLQVLPRTLSEPVFKITEKHYGDDLKESHDTLPESAYMTAAGLPTPLNLIETSAERTQKCYGSNTKKRFCAELLERGQARNQPRLFDAIQPLHCGPMDMLSLDLTSSMAPIREAAIKKRNEQRKKNADIPRKSCLWYDSTGMQPSNSLPSQAMDRDLGSAMDMNSNSMDARSKERTSSNMGNAPSGARPVARVTHVSSDPVLRTGPETHITHTPKEPRFFGNARTASEPQIGVRCGGFHRLDHTSKYHSNPVLPDKGKTRRNESRERPAKEAGAHD